MLAFLRGYPIGEGHFFEAMDVRRCSIGLHEFIDRLFQMFQTDDVQLTSSLMQEKYKGYPREVFPLDSLL